MARRRSLPDEDAQQAAAPDAVAAAGEICLRLLSARSHSRAELAEALGRKGVPEDVAQAVLERYAEVGLVDDTAFAETTVRSGHAHRGLGRRALRAELRHKGVSDDVAAQAVAALRPEDEERGARELVQRKLSTLAAGDEATLVRRLVGMLARKGYPEDLAFRVVRDELRADHLELPDPE